MAPGKADGSLAGASPSHRVQHPARVLAPFLLVTATRLARAVQPVTFALCAIVLHNQVSWAASFCTSVSVESSSSI
jgi:hypothetical protein